MGKEGKLRNGLIFIIFLSISGCDHYDGDKDYVKKQTEEDADQVAKNIESGATSTATIVRDKVKVTGERLRSWLITPTPIKKPNSIAASYCYRAQTDVLCYRQPVPGWEGRLLAFQGTDVTPPAPAQTQPLPKRVADASTLPENKVASAKPVFKELPPPPKEEEKDPNAMPVFDAAHEQLPNPLRSPQL